MSEPVPMQIHTAKLSRFKIDSDIRNPTGQESESVSDLVASFKNRISKGLDPIRYPIEVVKRDDGHLGIIAGRRRFRAAQELKLETVPYIHADRQRKLTEAEKLEHEISENTARKPLGPIEEAVGVVRLLAQKVGKSSIIQDLIVKKPNPTTEDKIISYLIKMTTYLGHDREEWAAERLRNKTFDEIVKTMESIGETNWAAYVQRIIYFLNYPEPLKDLVNRRIISTKSAQRIKKIKDSTLIQEISSKIEQEASLNKALPTRKRVPEDEIVTDCINKVMVEKTMMRKINDTGKKQEETDRELKKNQSDFKRNNHGWWYNLNITKLRSDNPYRDNFDSVLWDVSEIRNDMFIPPQIYDRIVLYNSRIGDNVLIMNPLDLSSMRIALERGRLPKIVSPESYSTRISRYPLDNLTREGYSMLSPVTALEKIEAKKPQNKKKKIIKEEGFADQSVALVILVLYPWGEINIPELLNWEDKTSEPTGQTTEALYTAQVGDILREALRVGRRVAVICRNSVSEKKSYCPTSAKIQQALNGYILGVNYFRGDRKKMWSVIVANSPLSFE